MDVCTHCGRSTGKMVYLPDTEEGVLLVSGHNNIQLGGPLYFCTESCIKFYLENKKQLYKATLFYKKGGILNQ